MHLKCWRKHDLFDKTERKFAICRFSSWIVLNHRNMKGRIVLEHRKEMEGRRRNFFLIYLFIHEWCTYILLNNHHLVNDFFFSLLFLSFSIFFHFLLEFRSLSSLGSLQRNDNDFRYRYPITIRNDNFRFIIHNITGIFLLLFTSSYLLPLNLCWPE